MNTPDTYSYLFAGYSSFWLLVCLFLLMLFRRQQRLAQRIQELEQRRIKENLQDAD